MQLAPPSLRTSAEPEELRGISPERPPPSRIGRDLTTSRNVSVQNQIGATRRGVTRSAGAINLRVIIPSRLERRWRRAL